MKKLLGCCWDWTQVTAENNLQSEWSPSELASPQLFPFYFSYFYLFNNFHPIPSFHLFLCHLLGLDCHTVDQPLCMAGLIPVRCHSLPCQFIHVIRCCYITFLLRGDGVRWEKLPKHQGHTLCKFIFIAWEKCSICWIQFGTHEGIFMKGMLSFWLAGPGKIQYYFHYLFNFETKDY